MGEFAGMKVIATGSTATALIGLSVTVANCAAVKPDWKKVITFGTSTVVEFIDW